jgi:ubiquinone/menaquinone biosynthesis C-methylase UbiE
MSQKPIASGKSSFDLIDFATLLSALDLQEETVFLDVACGAGKYAIEIARQLKKKGKVYAFDLWAKGIDQLKLKSGSLGLDNIEAEVCDVSKKLPIGDASIDIVLMATVLHDLIHDGTHDGTLSEIVRVLKSGGKLAVIEFKKIPGPPGPPEKVRLSPEALVEILQPLGFQNLDTVELGAATYLSLFFKQLG